MKKTWVFFKLRMRQIRYDKMGLFFSYVFPVLLLLGIGYPLEMATNQKIKVSYVEADLGPAAKRLQEGLAGQDLIQLDAYPGDAEDAENALLNNEIQHLLVPDTGVSSSGGQLELRTNSLSGNRIAAIALTGILRDAAVGAGVSATIRETTVQVSHRSSYLAVLLPGVIAMTLLIIGLSGFGSVLIGEESQGLFKNLKSIDVSPVPFFSGLFMSRMLVAYTVALAMFAISVFVLGVPGNINFLLLFIVVTLGAAMSLGIGLVIFLFSPTTMAFGGIVSVVQLPLILLGGVFFSVSVFPHWFRPFAEFSPMAPFTSALRDIMFGGVGFHNVSAIVPALATLSAWLIVFMLLTKLKFRW